LSVLPPSPPRGTGVVYFFRTWVFNFGSGRLRRAQTSVFFFPRFPDILFRALLGQVSLRVRDHTGFQQLCGLFPPFFCLYHRGFPAGEWGPNWFFFSPRNKPTGGLFIFGALFSVFSFVLGKKKPPMRFVKRKGNENKMTGLTLYIRFRTFRLC